MGSWKGGGGAGGKRRYEDEEVEEEDTFETFVLSVILGSVEAAEVVLVLVVLVLVLDESVGVINGATAYALAAPNR